MSESAKSELATELLIDGFTRVRDGVRDALTGLDAEALTWRPRPGANPLGWIAWHLSRVQDDHLADIAQRDQVWIVEQWAEKFGLPYPAAAIGYGQTEAEVARFAVTDPELLIRYADRVHELSVEVISGLTEDDFTRIVDPHWDPPVTGAVRLVSVLNDTTQHVGQLGYLRGLLEL